MSISIESLGIDRMSIEERLNLVHAILESIPADAKRPAITDALRKELDRRLADYLANPNDVVPWEEVKAAALARMRQ